MSAAILRDYQSDLNGGIYSAWDDNVQNVLAVLPTGGGKTVCIADIINRRYSHDAVCVIAHRQELVSQISIALGRNKIRHRIIGPQKVIKMIVQMHMAEFGQSFYENSSRIAVAGVDTLIRRHRELANWLPTVKLWVIDEAHHLLKSNKWGKAVEMFPNARGLGVTATPERADGKGLGKEFDGEFDKMVVGPSGRDLINDGYLCDYRIFAPPSSLKRKDLEVSAGTGEFKPKQMRDAVAHSSLVHSSKSTVTGDVVEHYLKLAKGKLGITFVPDMATGRIIEEQFNAAGIPAILVNAKTPDDIRASTLRKFRNREYLQLINVDLFGEGFDVPAVEVISMARPTKSYGLYVQMFGRVLRIMEGKEKAIIIDHVGNIAAFSHRGLPDKKQEWTLERKPKSIKNPPMLFKTCPDCTAVYERYLKSCPECGYTPEITDRTGPEFVDGSLEELDPHTLATLRGDVDRVNRPLNAKVDEYKATLQKHQCDAKWIPGHARTFEKKERASMASQRILRDRMAWWAGYCRYNGMSDDEIFKSFYIKFGIDWLTAQTLASKEADSLIIQVENDDDSYNRNEN